jgi:hypothetical protein
MVKRLNKKDFVVCSAGCINGSSELQCGLHFHSIHENVNSHLTHEDQLTVTILFLKKSVYFSFLTLDIFSCYQNCFVRGHDMSGLECPYTEHS